jgi:hypothetical protein
MRASRTQTATRGLRRDLKAVAHGGKLSACEASKRFDDVTLPDELVDFLTDVAVNGRTFHNRDSAAHALSRTETTNHVLGSLIRIMQSSRVPVQVRGQAAEGLGAHWPSRRRSSWPKVEKAILTGLRDPSPTVRFWCCYAAGHMHLRSALPELRRLKANDHAICRGWWRVSEEAEDAIEWIHGRPGEERLAKMYAGL